MSTSSERGYAMAALLVGLSIMAVAMSVALPVWHTAARREREAELIFRGQQYAHAITLFQRKYAGTFPPNLDVLVNERFLRKKYLDPVTGKEFQLVAVGDAAATARAEAGQPNATNTATGRGTTFGAPQSFGGQTAQTGQGTSSLFTTQPPRSGGVGLSTGSPGATSGLRPQTPSGGPVGGAAGGTGAGIMGVASKSTDQSLRIYNGRDHYNEWVFIATQAAVRAGSPTGGQAPGGRGGTAPGSGTRGGTPPGGLGGRGFGGASGTGFPQPGGGRR